MNTKIAIKQLRKHAVTVTPEHNLWFEVLARTIRDFDTKKHKERALKDIYSTRLDSILAILDIDYDYFKLILKEAKVL